MPIIVKRIFTEEESKEILEFLKEKAYVYHTPYKRYNKMVKVPRGPASFTMNENIHYNYGRIAGGSPPNEVMCDRLKEITQRVNTVMAKFLAGRMQWGREAAGMEAVGPPSDSKCDGVKG